MNGIWPPTCSQPPTANQHMTPEAAAAALAARPITAESVSEAVHALYHQTEERHLAHQWLIHVQRQPQAWDLAWSLLAPSNPTELRYFGASTLQLRLRLHIPELPKPEQDRVCERLLKTIIDSAGSGAPKFIQTRLFVALAGFVLHSSWENPIGDLVSLFSGNQLNLDANSRLMLLLEMLKVIPEEFSTTLLTKKRRGDVRAYFSETALPVVLNLLNSLLTVASTSRQQKQAALNVLSSWSQFGINLSLNSHLVNHIVQLITHNGDVELVCEALNAFSHLAGHPSNSGDSEAFFKFLLPVTVNKLAPFIHKVLESRDEDLLNATCTFLVSVADNHCKLIVCPSDPAQRPACLALVTQLILPFTAIQGFYPVDEKVSALTMSFWYNLQEDLPVSLEITDPNYSQQLIACLLQLVIVFVNKVRFPLDNSDWSSDEIEQFRVYRIDINDYIVSLNQLLNILLPDTLIQIFLSTVQKENAAWNEIEAPLYLLTGCSNLVEMIECETLITPVLQVFPRIMKLHVKVMEACCDLIGQLAEWICDSPQIFSNIVQLLLDALDYSPEFSNHSAVALKELAHTSLTELHPYAEVIVSKVRPIVKPPGCVTPTEKKEVMRKIESLLFVVGKSISHLSNDQIMSIVEELLSGFTKNAISVISGGGGHDRSDEVICWMELVTQMTASLECCGEEWSRNSPEPEAALVLLQKLDPVISTIVHNFGSHPDVVSSLCALYKRTYFNLRAGLEPLVAGISQLALALLQKCPSAPCVDLLQTLATMFGENQDITAKSFHMLCQFHQSGILQKDPDFINSVFLWLQYSLKESTAKFLDSVDTEAVYAILLCGISAAETLTFTNSVNALGLFIQGIVTCKKTSMITCMESRMNELVHVICSCIAGQTSIQRFRVDSLGGLLLQLSKHFGNRLEVEMKNVLNSSSFSQILASEAEKSYFISCVIREKNSRSNMRQICNTFSCACVGSVSLNQN